jgi:PKD repeat protein
MKNLTQIFLSFCFMLCCSVKVNAKDPKNTVSVNQNGIFLRKVVSNSTVQTGVGFTLAFIVDTANCKFTSGRWDFGDGTISNDANTTHSYNNIGDYSATFYYKNECGEFKTSFNVSITECPCEIRPCFEYRSIDYTAQFGNTSTSNYPIVAYH